MMPLHSGDQRIDLSRVRMVTPLYEACPRDDLTVDSRLKSDSKELTATPDPQPALPVDFPCHRQLHQLVKHIAMDQGFEIAPHMHIGCRLLSVGIDHHSQ